MLTPGGLSASQALNAVNPLSSDITHTYSSYTCLYTCVDTCLHTCLPHIGQHSSSTPTDLPRTSPMQSPYTVGHDCHPICSRSTLPEFIIRLTGSANRMMTSTSESLILTHCVLLQLASLTLQPSRHTAGVYEGLGGLGAKRTISR